MRWLREDWLAWLFLALLVGTSELDQTLRLLVVVAVAFTIGWNSVRRRALKHNDGSPWGVTWTKQWDRPPTEPSQTRGTKRKIVLIRHGHYKEGSSAGEGSLSDKGRQQAEITGKWLAQQGYNVQSVYCSDYTRARMTAEIVARQFEKADGGGGAVPVSEDPLLHEGSLYPFLPDDTMRQLPKASLGMLSTVHQQMEEAFRKYFYRPTPMTAGKCDVVVSHANNIRYWVCRALQLPPESSWNLTVQHCSVTVLEVLRDGKVVLAMYSGYGHIPCDLQSTTNEPSTPTADETPKEPRIDSPALP